MGRSSGIAAKQVLSALAIAVIVLLLGSFLFPVYAGGGPAPTTGCLNNAKQTAVSLLIYAGDENERLPLGPKWMDTLEPYSKNESIFHCPEVKSPGHGYAFSGFMAGAKLGSKDDAEKPLITETRNLERSVTEFLPQYPIPGRHKGKNIVSFADGHAKAFLMGPEVKN